MRDGEKVRMVPTVKVVVAGKEVREKGGGVREREEIAVSNPARPSTQPVHSRR